MQGVVNIEDLRKLAKRRLPKIAYDFIAVSYTHLRAHET